MTTKKTKSKIKLLPGRASGKSITPVRERNYLYGEKTTKVIIVRLTEKDHKKVMRKVGTGRTITEWFKKVAKID